MLYDATFRRRTPPKPLLSRRAGDNVRMVCWCFWISSLHAPRYSACVKGFTALVFTVSEAILIVGAGWHLELWRISFQECFCATTRTAKPTLPPAHVSRRRVAGLWSLLLAMNPLIASAARSLEAQYISCLPGALNRVAEIEVRSQAGREVQPLDFHG